MRNCFYLFLVPFFILSCKNREEKNQFTHKFFFENGVKVYGRFVNDSIRDGVFTYYYPSGEIGRVEVYERDSLIGPIVELFEDKKIRSFGYFNSKMTEFQFSFNYNGDTTGTILRNLIRRYSDGGKKRPIFYYLDAKQISFDTLGKIREYRGPLDFLTKEDSLDLDRSYPDWREQVRAWEERGSN
jgi:hypothetical protein